MAEVGNEVGNQVFLPVGVDQGKYGAGHGNKGQIVFRAFGEILHDVSKKFQLLNQVRKFGRVDLGEFHLQERELLVHASQNLWSDLLGTVMNKLDNFRHGPSLAKSR